MHSLWFNQDVYYLWIPDRVRDDVKGVNMLFIAIILFLVAAVFGLINLWAILHDKKTPKLSVLAHGIIAIFALFALVAYIVAAGQLSTLLIIALVLLGIAALGGFTLLTYDMSNKPIPKMFALTHPLVALIGLILLFVYLYQKFQ